ncbi:MAG: hypothetical protein DYG89_31565 [Caldilinea sp. CFX5]|nr:hypothetical protein [Caldilinea sp. CFX5]
MGNGYLYTIPAAKALTRIVEQSEFQLFYDHSDAPGATAIVVWHGDLYTQPLRPKQLAHLDMALIHRQSSQVTALIEIEDTTDNPKTLLGDLLATLLGSGIAIGSQMHWVIGPWTTLMVLAHVDNLIRQSEYQGRMDYLQTQVEQLLPHLRTNNAKVGRVILDSFVTQTELDSKLQHYVSAAIGMKVDQSL